MVLILLHILQNHLTLKKITLRFLQPGHTYLPNDSEFGDVECVLKTHLRLYTAEDFMEVMRNCRRKNKFEVTKHTKDDFFSIESIQNQITNRKCDIQKQKIFWLDTFEIELVKNEPTMLHMKSKLTDVAKSIDICKGGKGRKNQIDFETALPLLHPEGRELSTEKIKDLKDILRLIPSDA
ncbi:hypothetical protein HF086_007666 [Spodoptera exigua]|uniref:Uncharacterized protein n=1 Tax=Spodoptera exigua TaxID=7107 RepID=A0A922M799_SPOEX|nr:hypothetical protein HF086_007666 [Spodoptera exigua]